MYFGNSLLVPPFSGICSSSSSTTTTIHTPTCALLACSGVQRTQRSTPSLLYLVVHLIRAVTLCHCCIAAKSSSLTADKLPIREKNDHCSIPGI